MVKLSLIPAIVFCAVTCGWPGFLCAAESDALSQIGSILPATDQLVSVVQGDETIYLLTLSRRGATTSTRLYRYPRSEGLVDLPAPSRVFGPESVMAAQHDGFGDTLYVFDTDYTGCFDLLQEVWKEVSARPFDARIDRAVGFGQSDVALFAADGKTYCYHTITDTFRELGPTDTFFADAKVRPDTASGKQLKEILKAKGKSFGAFNHAILAVYMGSLILMGVYFARREKGIDDFFLAGRRIPWWAAALSIFGTQLSAITFMAIPAKAYSADWQYFIYNMSILFLAAPVACLLFVPFYRRLNVATAYEYLERRFDLPTRLFGSAVYVILQLIRIGAVLYLPALALAAVTGIPVWVCIIAMGILCTVYTVLGGIEAVIWTDVIQVIVLMGGALLCLGMILWNLGPDSITMFSDAVAGSKLSLGALEWDFTQPTLIVVLLSTVGAVVPYVSDQTVVQRYLTVKDERSAKTAVWANALLCVPASVLFFSLGTALYLFYQKNAGLLNPGMTNDDILPWFILNELPVGVSGILIAGVFAAAMSSLDSSMNSAASAIINDFVLRLGDGRVRHAHLTLARWLTVVIGTLGTMTALMLAASDIKSAFDTLTKLFTPFGGALCGLFLLGALSKRANGIGALSGGILGVAVVYIVQWTTEAHFFLYAIISMSTVLLSGYLISLATGGNRKTLDNLTMYTKSTARQHCEEAGNETGNV